MPGTLLAGLGCHGQPDRWKNRWRTEHLRATLGGAQLGVSWGGGRRGGLGVVRAAAGLGVAAKGKEGAGSLTHTGKWSILHLGGVCMW